MRQSSFLTLLAATLAGCAYDFGHFETSASPQGGDGSTPDSGGTTGADAMLSGEASTGGDGSPPVEASAGGTDAGRTADGGPACTADPQCGQSTPYCNTATSQCVRCLTNPNCSGTNTPYCSANQCVQCTQNSQCPSHRPTCAGGTCQ